MKPILYLRALFFYLGFCLVIGLFSVLSCTIGLLLPIAARQTLATTGNWLIVHWLRLTCGVRVRIIGLERLPPRPFVALSNHQSPWETFFLQRTLRPVSTILKRELLKVPFFGWGLAAVRSIAIDRGNPRQSIRDVMAQGQKRIAEGMNVLVFPEGTRMRYGEYGSYARSGTQLAIAANVPVVPIAHNAGRHWPSKAFLKYPGTITIVFGDPLSVADKNSKELAQLAETWIKDQQRAMA